MNTFGEAVTSYIMSGKISLGVSIPPEVAQRIGEGIDRMISDDSFRSLLVRQLAADHGEGVNVRRDDEGIERVVEMRLGTISVTLYNHNGPLAEQLDELENRLGEAFGELRSMLQGDHSPDMGM